MDPTLSIVVPYLSDSRCVGLCKDLLQRNTTYPFEICEVVDCLNVYQAYNEGVAKATGDIVVLLNDDMFVGPNWDQLIPSAAAEKTVVTTYLVEPGRHPVNYRNIEQDFGRTTQSFDYDRFVSFTEAHGATVPDTRVGLGWYMPFAVRRSDFILYREEPWLPCDTLLFGVFASRNYEFVQVRSYAYHLQRMTYA